MENLQKFPIAKPNTPLLIPTNSLTLFYSKNSRETHPPTHHHQYNPPNTSTRLQSSTLHQNSSTPNRQHHTHRLQQKKPFIEQSSPLST